MNIVTITKLASRAGLVIAKHAPEILTYGGLATMTAGTAVAIKKTPSYSDAIKSSTDALQAIAFCEKRLESGDMKECDWTPKEQRNDKAIAYSTLVVNTVKHYALPIALYGVGTACVVWGHNMLATRLASTAAAYGTLQTAYDNLKSRVEDQDQEVQDDILANDVAVEDGETVLNAPVSQYVYLFDPSNPNFDSKVYNEEFLRAQQSYFNDRLHARGFVFLNEVLEALGFPATSEGAVTGWLDDSEGDNYISFGISGAWNERTTDRDTYTCDYALDFNVDGLIWDRI